MVREQDAVKPKKVTDFEVAFTINGRMCDHVYDYMKSSMNLHSYVWEQNSVFEDTLFYEGYSGSSSGNSKVLFLSLKSGRHFGMFMSDFNDVILQKRFIDNQIKGSFCFCKKGNAQGVRLIFEES